MYACVYEIYENEGVYEMCIYVCVRDVRIRAYEMSVYIYMCLCVCLGVCTRCAYVYVCMRCASICVHEICVYICVCVCACVCLRCVQNVQRAKLCLPRKKNNE